MKTAGIKHIMCSAYSPTSNGMAERINQTITFVLCHFKHLGMNAAVDLAERKLNLCFNRSIGCSPITLINQHHPLDITKSIATNSPEDAVETSNSNAKANLEHQNKHRTKIHQYKLQDSVFIRSHEPGKLAPNWNGSYSIIEIHTNPNVVTLDNGIRQIRTNIRQIRPF